MSAAHGHGGHGDHGPDHAMPDHRGRLGAVLALTLTLLVLEVVGAVLSDSLALLADAGHVLTDVFGLTLGLVAAVLARRPATQERTWGYQRAEVLAAAAQAAVLLAVGVFVLVEAVRRLFSPPSVDSEVMLLFGIVGLVLNLASVVILTGGPGNLNTRAARLEVLSDALGSVAVVVAALLVTTTGWDRADPVASLVIGALIIPRTFSLLRESVDVLLESTPKDLDLSDVRRRILSVPHVHDVHDLHATQVATGLPVLTAHVVVEDSCFHDGHLGPMLDELQACLDADFNVEHSTIQFEARSHAEHEHETHP